MNWRLHVMPMRHHVSEHEGNVDLVKMDNLVQECTEYTKKAFNRFKYNIMEGH